MEWAREGLKHRDRIGLISAAVSDHTQIDEMAIRLRELGAKLSVSSMRVDPISVPLVKALRESGTQTLTIAPEAGSQRLRDIINKTQTEQQILDAVDLAEAQNFPQLKLYFMIGHPGETEADVQALVDLTSGSPPALPPPAGDQRHALCAQGAYALSVGGHDRANDLRAPAEGHSARIE